MVIMKHMIASFADRDTQLLFERGWPKRIEKRIQSVALRKLRYLDNAAALQDLRIPPGNRLEALRGHLAGYHSIRINNRWRIIFRWNNGQAHDVAIMDYH